MKNKTLKIICIILVIINILASTANAFTMTDIINKGKDFISSKSDNDKIDEREVSQLSNSVYSILQFIAVVVAVVMITILGIKYITGSVEMQADIKKTLVPYVIGAFMAFGAFAIWKVVVLVLENTNL